MLCCIYSELYYLHLSSDFSWQVLSYTLFFWDNQSVITSFKPINTANQTLYSGGGGKYDYKCLHCVADPQAFMSGRYDVGWGNTINRMYSECRSLEGVILDGALPSTELIHSTRDWEI